MLQSSTDSSVSMGNLCFGMSMGLGPKLDLDAVAAENQSFIKTRTSERQEMINLNDRLAAYIEEASYQILIKLVLFSALEAQMIMY